MNQRAIEALDEHGALKLPQELPLQNRQRGTITIRPIPRLFCVPCAKRPFMP